jgi:alpha-L-rhamnosidase
MRTLCLCLCLLLLPAALAAPLLGGLQVEGLTAPLAVTAPTPRISWQTGAAQQSYRLTVRQTFPQPALLWDSGAVASNSSHLIPYAGLPLPADSDFSLTVSATLAGIGLASASTAFSTAPAAPLAGAWLGLADTLRAALQLSEEPIARARLHVTGVGCYVALVNGQRVSPALAPGFGHAPSARALYNTYDVLELLGAGENVVGLRLGSCKWGAFGQYCTRGSAALCNAGWALLSVTQGGNTTLLATSAGAGSAWAAANTSVLEQHLWNGELFDATLEQEGWSRPGFAPAAPWAPAEGADTADLIGPLLPAPAPPVASGEALAPLTVTPLAAPGVHVFDLGVNVAGTCGLDLSAPEGEASVGRGVPLSLLHGEVLQLSGNGSVYNHYLPPGGTHQPNGLNQPRMNYTYVTRGGGGELMGGGPLFSYFGFRYIELRGWPYATPPTPQRLVCHFLHTELAPSGAVAFPGTPLLDALQAATLRTHLANFVSLPTDCPQREKRGWTCVFGLGRRVLLCRAAAPVATGRRASLSFFTSQLTPLNATPFCFPLFRPPFFSIRGDAQL